MNQHRDAVFYLRHSKNCATLAVMMVQTGDNMKKICRKCNRELPGEQFIRNKSCKNGRAGTCKDCSNAYSRRWKQENASRLAIVRRQQYAERYGPIQRRKEQERRDNRPFRVRAQLLRGGMRQRAKQLELPFDSDVLTTDYLLAWMHKTPTCPCCGVQLDYGFKHDRKPHDDSPSIDQVIPGAGYTVDNVALICWRCNNLKRDATPDELQKVVDWMRSRSPDAG